MDLLAFLPSSFLSTNVLHERKTFVHHDDTQRYVYSHRTTVTEKNTTFTQMQTS